jgi:Ca2+/Na+ antiporter
MSDRLFTFFMLLLFAGIFLGVMLFAGMFLSDDHSWMSWIFSVESDGLFAFFSVLLFAGIFLGLPGLISWFWLSLQGRILRRTGRRNASKIVRTIEFVCIFACSYAVLHHVAVSQIMT